MSNILIEATRLISNDGKVWAWKSDNIEAVNFFATKEDAQKYVELRSQWRQEKGMEAESYSIGTEADYMEAVKKYEADKKANEVKEYCKHVDALIEGKQLEIKALDGLFQVCRQFDGKVLNKRFRDAVIDTTDFGCQFGLYSLDFFHTEQRNGVWISFNFSISADWSHGINSYTGQQQDVRPDVWQWNTGDRLEAEKAVAVIEHQKNVRLAQIEDLNASKKKYAAYLRLARKAEAIMKEMEGYDYTIREFAKEKALSQYSHHSYFWNGY